MQTASNSWIQPLQARADQSGIFGAVELRPGCLSCAAKASAAPAWYRVEQDGNDWHVSLVTSDRWLSESIEADLMHHGDPIEELIEDELAELDYHGPPLAVKHYRSDDMLYTFRSRLVIDGSDPRRDADLAMTCLLAYEAAFRHLGDMNSGPNND